MEGGNSGGRGGRGGGRGDFGGGRGGRGTPAQSRYPDSLSSLYQVDDKFIFTLAHFIGGRDGGGGGGGGTCYAFQKGECTRGSGCRFSHEGGGGGGG